jgi:hypothetical protein
VKHNHQYRTLIIVVVVLFTGASQAMSEELRWDDSLIRQPFENKCIVCKKQGRTSTLTLGATMGTCMASGPCYYDEQGVYHRPPDPNTYTTEVECSNGHTLVIKRVGKGETISNVVDLQRSDRDRIEKQNAVNRKLWGQP